MGIKICDAICGSGKTTSCIEMMNRRTDCNFIFATQYLSEVERIKSKCASRNFVSPEVGRKKRKTKLSDMRNLLEAGKNIATTHTLFLNGTDEIKDLIKKNNYVLVLDEVVDIICPAELTKSDINILMRSDSIEEKDGVISWTNDEYKYEDGGRFREEMLISKSKNLISYKNILFFWMIPASLFSCFKEVYVLTYMFNAQPLRYFFDIYGMQYEYIGTKMKENTYEFCSVDEMDRARDLRDFIHILDNKRLNEIGNKRTALSYGWYQRAGRKGVNMKELTVLKNNVSNVFKNIFKAHSEDIMWTVFKEYEPYIKNKGFAKGFVCYNKRASNEYCNRHYLAYCVNNFMRPWESNFYKDCGVNTDSDMFALSVLLQWIFRSAIRNQEEIWMYIPSLRMRTLLQLWMENLAEGNDLTHVQYKTRDALKRNCYNCRNDNTTREY